MKLQKLFFIFLTCAMFLSAPGCDLNPLSSSSPSDGEEKKNPDQDTD